MKLSLHQRTQAFVRLGSLLNGFSGNDAIEVASADEKAALVSLQNAVQRSTEINPWFTNEFISLAISNIAAMLKAGALEEWVSAYPALVQLERPKTIAVVMAGNIPAVGFHDFLCVLLSGNRFMGKTSSDDPMLLPAIAGLLLVIEPGFGDCIAFRSDRLEGFDAVIATGSNNSARYFDYYFGANPHIIRRNRNGIAVLNGKESMEDLDKLAIDVFAYYGLGCRNVSYLLLDKQFDPGKLFRAFERFKSTMLAHKKYMNNYAHNKALMNLGKENFFDNGFVLLRESSAVASPMACLHYEKYDDNEDLEKKLQVLKANEWVQCVVSERAGVRGLVGFGQSQSPGLTDYADGIDTMKWLCSIANN